MHHLLSPLLLSPIVRLWLTMCFLNLHFLSNTFFSNSSSVHKWASCTHRQLSPNNGFARASAHTRLVLSSFRSHARTETRKDLVIAVCDHTDFTRTHFPPPPPPSTEFLKPPRPPSHPLLLLPFRKMSSPVEVSLQRGPPRARGVGAFLCCPAAACGFFFSSVFGSRPATVACERISCVCCPP